MDQPAQHQPWRERLARRLAGLAFALSIVGVLVMAFGAVELQTRVWLLAGAITVAICFGLLTQLKNPAIGVVLTFLLAGVVGYSSAGFLAGSGVSLAAAVVLAGLLLGRRAMYATMAASVLVVVVVGGGMVSGYLAVPLERETSMLLARPWLRTSGISLLMMLMLASAVTWAVENIEAAATLAAREAARREEAEQRSLAAQRVELIGQLAAGLAHDVNNHFTVIAMWSALLAEGHDEDDVKEATAAINESLRQATALTRQLLVLGRREVRQVKPLSLVALLQAYQPTLRRIVPADILVRCEPDADVWCVADEGQVHQVLLNLTMNARDAQPHGGYITVRTARKTDERGAWAVIEVEDGGAGMTDDVRQRAFEPFFSTKPVGQGSGLGLATVSAIAERSGGRVVLESQLGAGTRVALWLPEVPADAAPVEVAIPSPTRITARVLLAEDEPQLQLIAERVLENAGCTVVLAANGDEAVARATEGGFDILCCDVVMPGAPTRDVLVEFERHNPGAPVLLCSGYVAEDLVRRGIEEGRYPFLQKPYRPSQLVAEVAARVARSPRRNTDHDETRRVPST